MEPIECLELEYEIAEKYLKKFPAAETCFNAGSGIDEAEAKRLMQMAIKRGKPLTEKERGFLREITESEAKEILEELERYSKKV